MRYFNIIMFILSFGAVHSQSLDFELKNLDQEWVSINELKGEKLTVVDFWATWCKPCVTALPKLSKLHKEFKNQGVGFVGVNTDGPRNSSKVKPFVKTIGVEYPILLDPDNELVSEFNVGVLPTLLVFNSKGKIVFTHEGFVAGDEDIIHKELSKLLGS